MHARQPVRSSCLRNDFLNEVVPPRTLFPKALAINGDDPKRHTNGVEAAPPVLGHHVANERFAKLRPAEREQRVANCRAR